MNDKNQNLLEKVSVYDQKILEKAFFGPITPEVPASILQLHNDLVVIYSEK